MNFYEIWSLGATGISLGVGALLYLERMNSLAMQRAHDEELKKLKEQHIRELAQERSTSWKEGVRMGAEATKRKRDKAGRFA